jgi:hypothetical protein
MRQLLQHTIDSRRPFVILAIARHDPHGTIYFSLRELHTLAQAKQLIWHDPHTAVHVMGAHPIRLTRSETSIAVHDEQQLAPIKQIRSVAHNEIIAYQSEASSTQNHKDSQSHKEKSHGLRVLCVSL